MHRKTLHRLITSIIAAGTCASVVRAQSSDALLNKLVSKGILTAQEADELKKEQDAGFDKSYRARNGMPEWVTSLKLYGDLRGRFDHLSFENDDKGGPNRDRDRFRYRLRTGLTATMKDNLELGFRLISGEPNSDGSGGNPLSGNATMQNNASKKFVYIDLAYGKWTPLKTDQWTLSGTFGKMENPFVVSDIMFDPDYTPEGGALQLAYKLDSVHSFKLAGAGIAIDENNQGVTDDPFLIGGQLRWDAKWTKELDTTVGVAAFKLTDTPNLGNGAVPNINVGNTRTPAGVLVHHYTPIIADASIGYTFDVGHAYPGPLPVRAFGAYLNNPSASARNNGFDVGASVGRSGRKGGWEFSYHYKYLEADATYEEFPDDDFGAYYAAIPGGYGQGTGYRGGTNVKGHVVRASYSPYDALTFGATYYATELINDPSHAAKEKDSGTGRLFVDATWKF